MFYLTFFIDASFLFASRVDPGRQYYIINPGDIDEPNIKQLPSLEPQYFITYNII